MTREEAEAMVGAVRGAWPAMFLDDYGLQAWQTFFAGQDFDTTMLAYVRLSERQRELPTIADFRSMINHVVADERANTPAIEEAEFVRNMPAWFKGWAVARFRHRDFRVWPQQRPGYDSQQIEHWDTRTHVWAEQELMPDEFQQQYEDEAAPMSAEDISAMINKTLREIR